jgi:MoaA/NifB/PqqE/SkfB family radical SAM enzyme
MRHKFCFQRSFAKDRLPDQILYKSLETIYPHVELLTLQGGEITITPGMKEYVNFLGTNYPNLKINIITNGLKFDDEWIELSRQNNCIINFSLDAASESTTRKIIAKGDSKHIWHEIYGNFLKLVKAHEEHNASIINYISMVINDDTIDEIIPFTKLALNHGLNVMFQLPCNEDIEHFKRIDEAIYMLFKMKFFCQDFINIKIINLPVHKQVLSIWSSFETEEIFKEKRQFLKSMDRNIKKARTKEILYMETIGLNFKTMRCDFPWRGVYILPSGNVLMCCNMPSYVLGNIYYQSIEEILNGEPVTRVRELIKNNDYRYCFKRCVCNFNPESSVPGAENSYTPAYLKVFKEGNYKKVIDELRLNQNLEYLEPAVIYHLAFSLHMEGEKKEALKYYDLALKKGMEEFWVRYNRGSLYLALGEYEKAHTDLSRAIELKPDHEGVRTVMGQLNELENEI